MPSPEDKKQIYAKFPVLRLGRMGVLNILSENMQTVTYGVTCMSACVRVLLKLPRVLWKQVTAGHCWKHVKCGGSVCLFCQLFLLCYGLMTVPKEIISISKAEHLLKKKMLSKGPNLPSFLTCRRAVHALRARAPRLWWRGGAKGFLGDP